MTFSHCILVLLTISGINNFLLVMEVTSMTTPTTSAPTTHVVSYVHQAKKKKNKAKYDEFPDFDFENIRGDLRSSKSQELPERGAMLQLYGRLVQHLETRLDGTSNSNSSKTDDSLDTRQNTLGNSKEILGMDTHHESHMTKIISANGSVEDIWNRNKQSIPVLEPVKHLINSAREGALNHTIRIWPNHHKLVGSNAAGGMEHMVPHNESSAIETEEEREMVNESTEFKLLEVLGSLGGMIWNFIQSIQRIFAASSGNASSAIFSSSSGGGR